MPVRVVYEFLRDSPEACIATELPSMKAHSLNHTISSPQCVGSMGEGIDLSIETLAKPNTKANDNNINGLTHCSLETPYRFKKTSKLRVTG